MSVFVNLSVDMSRSSCQYQLAEFEKSVQFTMKLRIKLAFRNLQDVNYIFTLAYSKSGFLFSDWVKSKHKPEKLFQSV